jgi:hypothetical membrane protein
MNTSFVVLGLTMTLGSVLIWRHFATSRSSEAGFAALAISGVGIIMVGFFPENNASTLHEIGAAVPFVLGNASLIVLAASVKMPTGLRVYCFLSGTIALLGLVAYTSRHYCGLGEGGMERVVAYPQTVFLIMIGCYLAARRCRGYAGLSASSGEAPWWQQGQETTRR